jgi:nitroimidazol reductase NimA-like FMN-containing flavoprotein (pyridoxamine 5'-phosphate oxidase superfamily)
MTRRPDIRMTPAEVAAFLAGKRRAVVGTLDAQGAPAGEPVDFVYDADVATFTVVRGGAAERNLARDPRVVCSLEEFPSYGEIRGVTLHGRAVRVGEDRFRIEAERVESFDFRKMAKG